MQAIKTEAKNPENRLNQTYNESWSIRCDWKIEENHATGPQKE